MRRLLGVLALAALAGCGIDGEPVPPPPPTQGQIEAAPAA